MKATNGQITAALKASLKTYHATIYRNDGSNRIVNSVGYELAYADAQRVVRDINVALSLMTSLGAVSCYAELTEEA